MNTNLSPVEAASAVLAKHWDYKLPVDIVQIANSMEIPIYFDASLEHMSGQLVYDENKAKILINPKDGVERQRFTACQMLGHHVLGHGGTDRDKYQVCPAHDSSMDVQDANDFVAEIILPREAVRFYSQVKIKLLAEMAEIFAVSLTAVRIRLEKLGCIRL